MSPTTDLAATLLDAGAAGYASAAAGRLLERRPEIAESFGNGAFRRWKEHLIVRLRELSAALIVSEPALFVGDVVWSQATFASRDFPLEHLRASLEDLSEVLAEELPEGSREKPLDYLRQALEALASEPEPPAAGSADGEVDEEIERLALVYLEAALSGDRRGAIDKLLAAVEGGMPVETVYQSVLASAQSRVGDMWHRWEISVPQEHFVTGTTRVAMALLARQFELRPTNGKCVVVSVVPGNGHEIAGQALADYFDMHGWRTIHLGGQMPASDLALAVEVYEADLLALSLALSTHVRDTIEVVRRVRTQRPDTKILLGGGVVTRTPDLWRKLGGDGAAATYPEALSLATELTS